MSLRFFRELGMLVGVLGGTLIGYGAGYRMEPTAHMACAFLGMALGGAFVHLCIYGVDTK